MADNEIAPKDALSGYTQFEYDGHKYTVLGDRLIRDGNEFGIVVSPGWGAGFSTWTDVPAHHPGVVSLVLTGNKHVLEHSDQDELLSALGLDPKTTHYYDGGVRDLEVHWLPLGTKYRITEYDGSESVETAGNIDWQ